MNPDTEARRLRQRQWLWATAGVLLLLLLALIAGTVRFVINTDRASRESARQVDLNGRLRQMQAVLVALGDAETGQRGYLLTGDPAYLAPYHTAVARMPVLLASLEHIPMDPARLGEHPDAIRQLAARKLAELAETIRLRDGGQPEAALALVRTGQGRELMERARIELAAAMDAIRADRDAATREVNATNTMMRERATIVVAALGACLLLVAVQLVMVASAQRRHAAALAESERRHRTLVEEQHELISLASAEGTLLYLNPAYARHFGQATPEMLGRSLFEFVDPQDREAVRAHLRAVVESGSTGHSENRMVTPSGEEKWIAWTNSVQAGPAGEPVLHSVGRDVTQRRRAEEALRASEGFLARTGQVAGVGGWELNLATGALRWSDALRRIHEVRADFTPKLEAAIAFFAPEARETIAEAIRAASEAGQPFDLELPLDTANGRRLCVRTVGEAERGPDGRPRRLVGAMQDVTERKALQDRLAESERFVRTITDNLPVRIAYIDRARRYRFVNATQCRRFGLERSQILGRTRSELLGRPTPPEIEARVLAAFAGEPQRFDFEEEVEGELRHIQSQLMPDVDEGGQVRGLYTTGVDITALKLNERALRHLNEILDHSPDAIVQTDWKGRIHYMNASARRAAGVAPDAPVEGRSFTEFNTAETNERFATEIAAAAREEGAWLGETTVLAAGGRVMPVSHLVIAHRDPSGRVGRYSAVMRDITREVEGRRALKLQTATLASVIEAIPANVAVLDRALRFRLVNRSFERWRGLDRSVVVGRTVAELFGEGEAERGRPWAQRTLGGETVNFEAEHRALGTRRHMSISQVPLRLEDGSIDGIIEVAQDITVHRDEARRLLDLSERDPLTGALNRAGFHRHLERAFQAGEGGSLALLYIDLDRFKPVNDNHGHAVGDELLQRFVQRLQGLVRPTDAVARLGGDEFAIVLTGVRTEANAEAIADKVVEAARTPFVVRGLSLTVGASVGVAFGADEESGWQGLVERADARVYEAKAGGRGRRA